MATANPPSRDPVTIPTDLPPSTAGLADALLSLRDRGEMLRFLRDLCTLQELEATDLDLYPSVFLLNVPEIESASLRTKLRKYVEGGGSLCWFLGEEVKPEHYNTDLFKAGVFPLKIGDRPFDPLSAAYPDPEVRAKERDKLRTQEIGRAHV